jgi:histidinol-phosphate aminotransferase
MVDVPAARPLVVDEAYFEYGGETALPLIGDGVIVVRTFSKAFALASARVGYAIAEASVAAGLNERQQPAPVSTIGAALALAGLEAGPPDVSATLAERERLAAGLRSLGLEPLPSHTNFLLVPHARARELYEALLARGLAVRPSPGAIRITVHRPEADDRLLEALAAVAG